MNKGIIEKHIEYLKNNPEGYWFKRKLYGWGWTPATKEGWLVTLIFLGLVIFVVARFDPETRTDAEVLTKLLPQLGVLVTLLIAICYKKGEKPRWQWGQQKESDSFE